MTLSLEFGSRRSPVYGRKGMVAASQPLAVAVGLEMLRQGGNAADAAIATAAALNVTEPTSTGIGGDCFALYYDSGTGALTALNGSGRNSHNLSLLRLKREGFSGELPPYHPYTITVPGACAGWFDLLERFGTLSMNRVLAPAIQLAEDGFPVEPITAYYWQKGAERQLKKAVNGWQLTIDGHGPAAGELFTNRGLARTLKLIASQGRQAFYQGEIADAIVRAIQEAGGCLDLADLAGHKSTWETPISTTMNGLRLWECPPNGQGLAALLAVNLVQAIGLDGLPPLSPQRLHIEIEAMRLAFADARWYVSDPAFSNIPVGELISMDYARDRSKLINLDRASQELTHGVPFASTDTVYFCVVDAAGNACSFINSNYMGFGTGIVPDNYGFTLQNRGHSFSLIEGHPNQIEPGKRPYHTIIPAMITREPEGSLFGPMGVMGGFMQPQGHLQVFLSLVVDGLDPQACLDLPRFCIEDGEPGGLVALEVGLDQQTCDALASQGHKVRMVSGMERSLFGRGQVIIREGSENILVGGSDPRADGCAMPLI